MKKQIVTRETLQAMLSNENQDYVKRVIGRALVAIFNNQTESEKTCNATNNDNGIGFTGADAHSGCLTAKYFIKHGTLADWQVERWTKLSKSGFSRLTKYHKQLNAIAIAKESK